jgi:hypothetical protein
MNQNTWKIHIKYCLGKRTSLPIIMSLIFCLGEQAPPPLFLNKLPFKSKKGQRNNIMGWERIKEIRGKEWIGDE